MSFLNPDKTDVRRRRILVGGASVVLTTILMTGFLLESRWGYSGKTMNLIYMQSWRADRTRDDTIADTKATTAVQEAKMAQSRAYIATLTGPARKKAQEQYDKYVAGGGAQKEVPYVRANSAASPGTAASEPPVL